MSRVFEIDTQINLFPFPLDFGTRPRTIFFHIRELSHPRMTEIRECLQDAHRAWPYLAIRVRDFFFEQFNLDNTILRLFRPSQGLIETILLILTRGPSHTNGPTPAFFVGNDNMPHYIGLREWCDFHGNMIVDDRHMDSYHVWSRYLAFPYMSATTPALGAYFAEMQARLQAQPSVTDLEQLNYP